MTVKRNKKWTVNAGDSNQCCSGMASLVCSKVWESGGEAVKLQCIRHQKAPVKTTDFIQSRTFNHWSLGLSRWQLMHEGHHPPLRCAQAKSWDNSAPCFCGWSHWTEQLAGKRQTCVANVCTHEMICFGSVWEANKRWQCCTLPNSVSLSLSIAFQNC